MDPNQELESVTRELICKDFETDLPFGKDQVLEALRQAVLQLLLHDLHKLWNILYRIDVNEQKVKALFDQNDPKLIAPGLALLIFDREMEKARTRLEYRNR